MNMRGDNNVQRRGKTKQFRGPKPEDKLNSNMPILADFNWGEMYNKPRNLIAFNEIPGGWTYPKKGFIQWKVTK